MIRLECHEDDEIAFADLARCGLYYHTNNCGLEVKTPELHVRVEDLYEEVYQALVLWASPGKKIPRQVRSGHVTVQAYLRDNDV